jgi:hypothetical protein
MKMQRLILAAFVLALLTGTLYWSEHRKPADTTKASADAAPVILKLDEAAITKLELKKKGADPVVLTKNNSGAWQIVQPQPLNADQSAVSTVVTTLSSLNSDRLIDDKASDLRQYGLDTPTVEVALTEKDNKTQKLLLGDNTPAGNAVYAMLAGDPRVFTVAGFSKSAVDKTLNDLRDKRLLTIDLDKISRLELDRKNQTIEFGRNKEDWQILKPTPLRADSAQVGDLAQKLSDARMDTAGPGPQTDAKDAASAFAKATPVATVKLTDPSGTQELQIRKDKDTYYAKSTAVDGIYKVSPDLAQAMDKSLDDFRNKKVFDFGYTEPSKVEMHNGSTAYFLTKGGNDWWSNGKKMDPTTVEAYLSGLRDLTATKFPDSGFANPTIEITVTREDNKTTEKISIAKSPTAYIAKRENESTLYQLDAPTVEALLKSAEAIKPASSTPPPK